MKKILKPMFPLKDLCNTHKAKYKEFSYYQWVEYAEAKHKKGERQEQCPVCGFWLFKDEF